MAYVNKRRRAAGSPPAIETKRLRANRSRPAPAASAASVPVRDRETEPAAAPAEPPATRATPTPAGRGFPVVAVGASAGGLDAFKKFLAALPADSGMAFVLIPHLDPRHESMMVELLAKQTPMPVSEARHRAPLRPNHVYVIPPNKYLAVKRRALVLSAPPPQRGAETAIDFALCSVAEDQGEAAVGIVLSGTGSHGTLGVKEIKLAGGMVMAQEPATAEYDQMPRSAVATGLVDYVLPPEKMPEALLGYWHHASRNRVTDGEPRDEGLKALQRVLALLHARAKIDFHHYRKNMIMRRVRRRMALLQIETFPAYIQHLRDNAEEVTALYKDLLIGVTAFFRDPEAFAALAEHVVPALVKRADPDRPIRVWVPGCATGEEAYSIAILLSEEFRSVDKSPNIQIFATDVDETSLETARQSVYPDSITSVISPERLTRFFTKLDAHHYQVSKQIRESVVFAPQNLIGDAPFSRLDLISCRNVLIYLEPDVQAKVISLLHFALNEDGYLLLGPSESTSRPAGLFETVSKKWRLYRRIGPARRDLVSIPIAAAEAHRRTGMTPQTPQRPRVGFTELMQKLLAEDFAPASALIDRRYEILSMQGPLVNYLEFPAGDMTKDLLTLARPGLRAKIRAACQKAIRDGETVKSSDVRVRRNGAYVSCTVTVRPVTEPKDAHGLLLVAFQDRSPRPPAKGRKKSEQREPSLVAQLEGELRATREDLQSTIEELESSNEEIKASSEEVMSMNEELQSTNEELETSKEELQSLNEELVTVNSQLQEKVEDLDTANSDLTNLMTATDIATVFLDERLKIKRFTAPTARLLNLMASDIGRPFRDFAPRFKDDDLQRDAREVFATLKVAEKEVQTDEEHWYLRRILPYRAGTDRVAGVVITFVDITGRVAAEAQARRLAATLLESIDAVTVCDLDGRITAWNDSAERLYGYSENKALTMNVLELAPAHLRHAAAGLLEQAAQRASSVSFEAQRATSAGQRLDVWVTITPLKDERGKIVALSTTERDITARRHAEDDMRSLNATLERRIAERTAALQASERRIRSVLDSTVDAIITIDSDGAVHTFNSAAERIFGYSADEVIGHNVKILMGSPYREEHDTYLQRYRETREPRMIGTARTLKALRKDGTEFPIQLSVSEVADLGLFTGIIRDMTEQRTLQEEIVRIATSEQYRIGQELHDNAQQELTGLGLLAADLSDTLSAEGPNRASEIAARLAAGISETNRHIRSLAKGLVPVPIDAEGLMAALDEFARTTEELRGVRCHFDCPRPVRVADDFVAMHLYRIAQEAVTNALKHAGAKTITIRLEDRGREILLEVLDDGIGIREPPERKKGLGLRIMQHRCTLAGGAFTVRRRSEGGTAVSCSVPRAAETLIAAAVP
ncbi:MAG TPA: chemotaxis protein CheB [Gammaproteobacteria bacterium]|nr:chemotaxis protein CheB [Gammaproteobacteria bacterium]